MSKPTRRALIVAACGLALTAWGLAASASEPDPDPSRFDNEIRAFEAWDEKNAIPPNAVLFVGSSSIRLWPTAESFPDLPVVNRGFGGSHISDVNHFADRIVLRYQPRVIVFYAGDNDIAAGKSPQQVFDDFRQFAQIVAERLPQAQLIYLPIKPSLDRWKLWPHMQKANALVEEWSKANQQLTCVDTAAPMLGPDSLPRPELFLDDGLHMNAKGYRLWTKVLDRQLRQLAASGH
jgi:lysophospholipase L1-like esterase